MNVRSKKSEAKENRGFSVRKIQPGPEARSKNTIDKHRRKFSDIVKSRRAHLYKKKEEGHIRPEDSQRLKHHFIILNMKKKKFQTIT